MQSTNPGPERYSKWRPRSFVRILVLVVLSWLVASCAPSTIEIDVSPREGILLWHNLPDPEATALTNVLDRYRRANPDLDILVERKDALMEEEAIRASQSGLGPNLLLTSSTSVPVLANAGALLPLDELTTDDVRARFLSTALQTLYYDGKLYGLPVGLDTQVLYYNRSLVKKLPVTVDQLLQEASDGSQVLMNSQFADAMWSARAFGVDLFDGQGQPKDATAGIANWLTWMEQVRDTPGFVTDDNTEALRSRFLEGDIPYYIGHSLEMNLLSETLGSNLGLTQLPSGPGGSAGPLLTTHALLVSSMSSGGQIERSMDLARFITSSDQQAALMREANVVPANTRTRVSQGLYPEVATVEAQARTAIPRLNSDVVQQAYAVLSNVYNQTMIGALSATEAAATAQSVLAADFGFPKPASVAQSCMERGQLTVLVGDEGASSLMRTLVDGFSDVCPEVEVTLQRVTPEEMEARFEPGAVAPEADLFFDQHWRLRQLAASGAIRDVTGAIDPALVQQLRPVAAEAMKVDGRLYGVPVFVDLQTLFYNRALLTDAAGTLADLRAQAQSGIPIILDGDFSGAFWGLGAFGGRLYGDRGEFALAPEVLTQWLAWLQESQRNFGIRIDPTGEELTRAFDARETAYHITSASNLNVLLPQIGQENLAVSLIPEGPVGPGRPLAWVDGLMVNAAISDEQAQLAALFMSYAAGVTAQNEVLALHRLLPANNSVLIDYSPAVMRMAEQLQTAQLFLSAPWLPFVVEQGDMAFRSVLVDGDTPSDAVARMYEALTKAAPEYGLTIPTPQPTATPAPQPTVEPTPSAPPEGAGVTPSVTPADVTPPAS